MDVAKISACPSIPISEIIEHYDLGKQLSEGKTSEFITFRLQCREFIYCLIVTSLKTTSATSAISRGINSFCPELMLDGDDSTAFALFAGLCEVLETCGVLALDESKAALQKYTSYIVERRRSHANSRQSANDISDVMQHLLGYVVEFSGCLIFVVFL